MRHENEGPYTNEDPSILLREMKWSKVDVRVLEHNKQTFLSSVSSHYGAPDPGFVESRYKSIRAVIRKTKIPECLANCGGLESLERSHQSGQYDSSN